MRFWDSSAIVPLLIEQAFSPVVKSLLEADRSAAVWWASPVECVSAIARLRRDKKIDDDAERLALQRLKQLRQGWHDVLPSDAIREQALRLLWTHALRAGDALQLAAATVVSRNRPAMLDFVCLDQRLSSAAVREGFALIPA